ATVDAAAAGATGLCRAGAAAGATVLCRSGAAAGVRRRWLMEGRSASPTALRCSARRPRSQLTALTCGSLRSDKGCEHEDDAREQARARAVRPALLAAPQIARAAGHLPRRRLRPRYAGRPPARPGCSRAAPQDAAQPPTRPEQKAEAAIAVGSTARGGMPARTPPPSPRRGLRPRRARESAGAEGWCETAARPSAKERACADGSCRPSASRNSSRAAVAGPARPPEEDGVRRGPGAPYRLRLITSFMISLVPP